MKQYKNHTLSEYLVCLSKREPVPGGGSAAAYSAAMGVGLLLMVANYSKGKGANQRIEKRIDTIIKKAESIRRELLTLVDLDAKAYLNVCKTKKGSKPAHLKALREARAVMIKVTKLSYKAIELAPFLVEKGNKYLIGDVAVACELLQAAYNGAYILAESN